MQIGRVSEQTGLSIDAIRFYEKQRLLERPPRTEGGFRQFGEEDIQRILFIRRAQKLGFSLPEIRELLLLQRENGTACSHVRELLRAKVSTVREKIRELGTLEQQLTKSLRKCERNLKPSRNCSQADCPVLRAISRRGAR
jgi:DNA-binding transcriptional MerR regulator